MNDEDEDENGELYQFRRISFIKAVCQATGACLHWSKVAVDFSIAIHGEKAGTIDDFIEAVRFLTMIQQEYDVDITHWDSYEHHNDIDTALRVVNSEVRLTTLFFEGVLEYWQPGTFS